MVVLAGPTAADSSSTAAAFGLAGVLIGGFIAGVVSLLLAKQAREAAERAWIRDNRRETYDRFLTCAQSLLVACQASRGSETKGTIPSVETTFATFFAAYGVVQTVADKALVDAARKYTYRLWELKASLDGTSVMGPEYFSAVAQLIRLARHDTIDAMRADLGLVGSARPPDKYNPFSETDLAQQYAEGQKSRPRPEA